MSSINRVELINGVDAVDGTEQLEFRDAVTGEIKRASIIQILQATLSHGIVNSFANLPPVADHSGEIYNTLNGSGVYWFSRKPKGRYFSDGVTWAYVGELPEAFDEANFNIYQTLDPTIKQEFDLSDLTATRKLLATDHDVDLNNVYTDDVFVRVLSDFPSPSGGIITLVDKTRYIIEGDINIGTNRLLIGSFGVIEGANNFIDSIIYTGTDSAIFSNNNSFTIRNIEFTVSSGKAIEAIATTPNLKTVMLNNIAIINPADPSEFTDFGSIEIVKGTFAGGSHWLFKGLLNGLLRTSSPNYVNLSGVAYDFGTSKFEYIDMHHDRFDSVDTAIAGLGQSNLTSQGIAYITGQSYKGVNTPIVGFGVNELQWLFKDNFDEDDNLGNSSAIGEAVVAGNSIVTDVESAIFKAIKGDGVAGSQNARFTIATVSNESTVTNDVSVTRNAVAFCYVRGIKVAQPVRSYTVALQRKISGGSFVVLGDVVDITFSSATSSKVSFQVPILEVKKDDVFRLVISGDEDDVIITDYRLTININI